MGQHTVLCQLMGLFWTQSPSLELLVVAGGQIGRREEWGGEGRRGEGREEEERRRGEERGGEGRRGEGREGEGGKGREERRGEGRGEEEMEE